jgi:flagellar biosynthesis anti-sigma factor FlgM
MDSTEEKPDRMNVSNDLQIAQSASAGARIFAVGSGPVKQELRTSSESADQANLSGAAGLARVAASLPDVRAEKVQAVQAAIASGDYKVSAEDVANSLMDHMLGGKE